jgi:hypothetical protein
MTPRHIFAIFTAVEALAGVRAVMYYNRNRRG